MGGECETEEEWEKLVDSYTNVQNTKGKKENGGKFEVRRKIKCKSYKAKEEKGD